MLPAAPEVWVQLAAGGFMLALAGLIASLDFTSRVNRAFALFLVLRGALNVFQAIDSGDGGWAFWTWQWAGVAVPWATAYFFWSYRDRFVARERWRWFPWALLGLALVAEAVYAYDRHALFGAESPWLSLYSFMLVAYGAGAWLFARDYARAPEGRVRRSLFLVSLAFALDAFYYGLASGVTALFRPTGVPQIDNLHWMVVATSALAVPPTLAAWASVASVARSGGPDERRARTVYGAWLAVVLASVVAVGVAMASGAVAAAGFLFNLFDGLWTLLLPILVAYAVLRHRLFDLDVRVKWTISRGTLAAVFVVAFLAFTATLQEFFNDRLGLVFGGVATGALLFAVQPIQRFADRVANAAMPGVKPVAELSSDERAAIYREQARLAWADGVLSLDERKLLDGLRARLGLGAEEASRLEGEATA